MENSKGKETEGESRGKSTTRREQLYGTARTEAREAAQELQQQDHVFENFQRGTQPMESYSEALQSETIASFRVGLYILSSFYMYMYSYVRPVCRPFTVLIWEAILYIACKH